MCISHIFRDALGLFDGAVFRANVENALYANAMAKAIAFAYSFEYRK